MFPQLIDDHGLLANAIVWLLLLCFFLLISITLIKLIQLCFTCHLFFSRTLYQPVYKVYMMYQDFMRIQPIPAEVIDV
ncbi:E protein [NL63-related bat coronavirus]|uniref:Envelope small membrane protein n=1 Tax=NL63-related bat coronavirus TaxID=1920748 RepID=A0A1L2KGD1_9ALPC|nr:E protein [NL63-related bat coronavirus]APD51485.1 E protein [NL63-related bat coronavirus]